MGRQQPAPRAPSLIGRNAAPASSIATDTAAPPNSTTANAVPNRATDVDHIIPGDNHDEWNLTSLCSWHHLRKSSADGIVGRKAGQGYVTERPARAPSRAALANNEVHNQNYDR